MAKKSLVWTDNAKTEFKEILDFFNKRNGNSNYSLKLYTKTYNLLDRLIENELIGRLTTNKTSRVLVMDVYLIFYEIHDKRILIISFWDNRQSPSNRIDNL